MFEKLKQYTMKSIDFVKDVLVSVKNQAIEFVKGLWNHAETITILTFSSIGLSSILSEIPFAYTVPMWIELPMVIPVVSVLLIIGLVKLAEYRAIRREESSLGDFSDIPTGFEMTPSFVTP